MRNGRQGIIIGAEASPMNGDLIVTIMEVAEFPRH
jgi:hypothetical protein